jgi:hypothetical protein
VTDLNAGKGISGHGEGRKVLPDYVILLQRFDGRHTPDLNRILLVSNALQLREGLDVDKMIGQRCPAFVLGDQVRTSG